MSAIFFAAMPWESSRPGARFKRFTRDGRQLRILELTKEFTEPDWCEKGHHGIVLQGELALDFKGRTIRYVEGAGILVPAGPENAHKAHPVTTMVRLFLVEEA